MVQIPSSEGMTYGAQGNDVWNTRKQHMKYKGTTYGVQGNNIWSTRGRREYKGMMLWNYKRKRRMTARERHILIAQKHCKPTHRNNNSDGLRRLLLIRVFFKYQTSICTTKTKRV